MANEITLNVGLSITKGGATVAAQKTKTLDITGDEGMQQIVSIDYAADQALDLSILDTVGQLMVENLDESNYLELSFATGGGFAAAKFAKIRAGCSCLLQPNSATIYAQANTAAVVVRITAVEI